MQSTCAVECIFLKLQRLSKGLQKWGQRKVGNIKAQLELAKEILHRLEIERDSRALSDREEWLRKKLKLHCLGLASLERTIARLRSRILYLREGDANTAFFHQQARYTKKNFISKLQVGNQVVVTQDEKQKAVDDFYESILGTAEERDYTLDLDILNIQHHNLSELDASFSEEEVWATIKDMPLDKAPGPDGFTGRFYKSCWSIIKGDVMRALEAIQQGHVFKFRLLNTAFITLLPKKVDAVEVKDFRPISLIHSFAKLVTKILANRLAPMLPSLISANQSAFVRGRKIHDNFMLVQQMVKTLHKKKEAHILLKLDISKAFDSVSWSFLLEVMCKVGFGQRWRDLICLILSTSSTQVLVNGEPGDSIFHHRGLRQGDPLSPMLFILVMDVLNSLVNHATSMGLLQPLAIQQARHRVSFYADDAVIFLRPYNLDLITIKHLLDLFGHASGLRTNLAKSSVSPIHCTDEELALTADILSCSIKFFPCMYLGLPLSIGKPTKEVLLPLVDKVADYLPGWKASLMNRAGRLVMVKVVLTAVPIYLLTALDLPKWVIKAIDKKRRGFLWKGHQQANGGNCLVAWEKVQRPLEYGGLGIHNLELLGCALKIRWLWAQKTDAERPWAGLPISVPHKAEALFNVAVDAIVGNGEEILFWKDRWLGGHTMAEIAPNLFKAVPNRTAKRRTVAQALHHNSWVQDIKGARTVVVMLEYLRIWDIVDGFILHPEIPYQYRWKLTQDGSYTSKSAYAAFFEGTIKFGSWRRIWKTWAPPRCKFFIWLVFHNRVWTADRLARRNLPHPEACPLCDQENETINHLLVGCVFARQVWALVLHQLGMLQLAPQPTVIRFSGWWKRTTAAVPKDLRKGLNSLIILVAWEIWKHRNSCVFDKKRPSVQEVLRAISSEGGLWCSAGASKLQELVFRLMPSGA